MKKVLGLVLLAVLFVGCSMLEPGMHDPERPIFKASQSNIIGSFGGVVNVENTAYSNYYEASNTQKEIRILQSLDYVSLDGEQSVIITENCKVDLIISGAPVGYKFYIYPYLDTEYEVF